MPTLTKFYCLVEDLAEGVHNLGADNLRLALSNTAPALTNTLLTNITQIAYTNLASDPTSRNVTIASSSQTTGTYSLVGTDQTLTASGGAIATFQYIVLFNEGTTVKVDPLIGWWDYGSALTLNDGESLTVDYGANGAGNGNILTMT